MSTIISWTAVISPIGRFGLHIGILNKKGAFPVILCQVAFFELVGHPLGLFIWFAIGKHKKIVPNYHSCCGTGQEICGCHFSIATSWIGIGSGSIKIFKYPKAYHTNHKQNYVKGFLSQISFCFAQNYATSKIKSQPWLGWLFEYGKNSISLLHWPICAHCS